VTRLSELFDDLIPGLAERAEEYRAEVDVLDGETWTLFVVEMRRSLARLEAGSAARNADTVRGRGHSLEGMGGTMGLPGLSVVGAELSQAGREQDWERCTLLTQRLGAWAAVLREAEGEV
jgi:HPt (histidine-containing phosphotransfer) domain-containing protein